MDKDNENLIQTSSTNRGPRFGKRHLLSLLAFFGFFNVYALRVNMSVALVAMVNKTTKNTNKTHECPPIQSQANITDSHEEGEFLWDDNTQGLVLASFFYGYIITQLPGGWLAQKFGGDKLFGFGVFSTAALTLLTPIAARTNVYLLVALRVLEGLGEAVTFPAIHALFAKWSPPHERARLLSFTWAGVQAGTLVSLPASGLLCKYGFDGGWPSVFYVFGSVGVVWFVLWWFLTYPSPDKHPTITSEERTYIHTSIGALPAAVGRGCDDTPWAAIFTSRPFWALVVTHVCCNWGFYTLLTEIPTYLEAVLGYEISEDGFLSALPYLVGWLMMVGAGFLADFMLERDVCRVGTLRKTWTCVGLVGLSACLVGVALVGCDHIAAVTLLTLAVGIYGFVYAGFTLNHIELAPHYAGVLMGITNSFATIPGFLSPQVVGLLTEHHHGAERGQWQIVFYMAAAISTFGAVVFSAFGSSQRQVHWDRDQRLVEPVNTNTLYGEIS